MAEKNVPTVESIIKEINKKIAKDPNLQAWLSQYRKAFLEDFIADYAREKQSALTYPTLFLDDFKPMNKLFNGLAKEGLEHIQQKKLFNLQCEWRAKRIQLPFVKISYDFKLFGENIMDCPFLPPVTKAELEFYMEYRNTPRGRVCEADNYFNWQNYYEFKRSEEDEAKGVEHYWESMPDWYHYYDEHHDTDLLFKLPDYKGDSEEKYENLSKEKYYADLKAKEEQAASLVPAPVANPPVVPTLAAAIQVETPEESAMPSPFSHETKIEFALLYEDDAEMAEIVISHIKKEHQMEEYHSLDDDFEFLKKIPESIKFVPAEDWQTSMQLTVEQYLLTKTMEALPRVWRKHNKEVGNNPAAYLKKRIADFNEDLLSEWDIPHGFRKNDIRRILEGRERAGEPRDFDY